MTADAHRPELSDEAFRVLRELLERSSGFSLREELRFLADRRLGSRLEALGLADFDEYLRLLRFDARGAEELELALDALVPRETYFFRERDQLDCFSRDVLPWLARDNASTRSLRLWSAGCSTGEEAYTLAMLVEASGLFSGWHVEVYATDISRKALTTARRGEYGESSFRSTSPQELRAYFDPLTGDRHAVKARYRDMIRWGRVNLNDPAPAVPVMDAIFCRNVLIYFERPTRRRVVDRFFEVLRPGGWLLLGHSENLLNEPTRFVTHSFANDLVYRRPEP